MAGRPFDDVTLDWKGRTYRIKGTRLMGAIKQIEREITLFELIQYAQRETIPIATLSSAFAILLRYAGASVTEEEIFKEFDEVMQNSIMNLVHLLVELMTPPKLRAKMQAEPVDENPTPPPELAPSQDRGQDATPSSSMPTSSPSSIGE